MSAKLNDKRPAVRSSGAPLSDRRAVVGSSGKPLPGMILESGAATVAKKLGTNDRPSGPHGQDTAKGLGGMRFNVDAMEDKSIGRAPDPSNA